MKKLLLLTLLLSFQASSADLRCEMYGICPNPCDKLIRDHPDIEEYFHDGEMCVTRLDYGPQLVGEIDLAIDLKNNREVYIDMKDGTKLLLAHPRWFFELKLMKQKELERQGFKIHGMSLTVRNDTFATHRSTTLKRVVKWVLKLIEEDITKDDCEIIKDGLEKAYRSRGDTVSDRVIEKEAREICDRAHEKAERNEREMKEIRDRMD